MKFILNGNEYTLCDGAYCTWPAFRDLLEHYTMRDDIKYDSLCGSYLVRSDDDTPRFFELYWIVILLGLLILLIGSLLVVVLVKVCKF